jgi:hypothetical protein
MPSELVRTHRELGRAVVKFLYFLYKRFYYIYNMFHSSDCYKTFINDLKKIFQVPSGEEARYRR